MQPEQSKKRRAEILARLREMVGAEDFDTDIEAQHIEADELLCEYLTLLGETSLVEAYKALEKWYE